MNKLTSCLWLFIAMCLTMVGCSSTHLHSKDIHLIPEPVKVKKRRSQILITNGYTIVISVDKLKPLIPIISKEMFMLAGVREDSSSYKPNDISIHLSLNPELKKEQYDLNVSRKGIFLQGGSYRAVAEGSVTLLQLINNKHIPELEIQDSPAYPYRALMIDVARTWHSIGTLEKIVNLCRWYKIRYLQLHLTDDQSFTFPSKAYPRLPTKGRHYTWSQLAKLDKYASRRGVTIIPEIEMPGHAYSFIKAMPKLFGIKDWRKNPYTLDMGKDTVYKALNAIIGELAQVFPQTPYIHLGTDEVFMGGMKDDPSIKHYMTQHGLHSLHGLYRSFITRVGKIVESYGKQPIVWNGFQKASHIKVPTDVVVMEYLPFKYPPQALVDAGYRVINASFKPLYNGWGDAADVYEHWNVFNWQLPMRNLPGKYKGIEIKPTNKVIGASMSNWSQPQIDEIPSSRRKLAAMSEKVWSTHKRSLTSFMHALDFTDKEFGRILSPAILSVKGGVAASKPKEGIQSFDSTITIRLKSTLPNVKLHYTLDGSSPGLNSPVCGDTSLTFRKSIKLRIQAYNTNSKKIGFTISRDYRLKPVSLTVKRAHPPGNLDLDEFDDSVSVTLNSHRGNLIRYSLKGPVSRKNSPTYSSPIMVNHSATLTAQAYDAQGNPIGLPTRRFFTKIRRVTSLTTNKPVSSSTDKIDPRLAKLAVDGIISDKDYWHDKAGGWVEVDLGKKEKIAQFRVYTFWDNSRYYQYVIKTSLDGKHWRQVVDFSHNNRVTTLNGYVNNITPAVEARYVKIIMLYNSANPIMHLVELAAFSTIKN